MQDKDLIKQPAQSELNKKIANNHIWFTSDFKINYAFGAVVRFGKAEYLIDRNGMIREGVCFAGGQSVTVILKS